MIKKAYFKKLFFSYIGIALLPLAILSCVTYFLVVPRMVARELEHSGRLLEYVSQVSELVLSEAWSTALNYASDDQFQAVSYPNEEDIFLTSQVIDKVDHIKSANELFHSVYLYLGSKGKIIASEDWYNDVVDYYDMGWLPHYTGDRRAPVAISRTIEVPINNHNEIRKVDVITVATDLSNGQGMVVLNIYENSFRSVFENLKRRSGKLLIIDENGKAISHYDQNRNYTSLSDEEYIRRILNGEGPSQFTAQVDGNSYGVTYVKAPMSEWIYVDLVGTNMLALTAKTLSLIIMIAALLCAGGGVAVTILLSKKMYSPIRHLVSRFSGNGEAGDDAESSSTVYDEFMFLDNTLDTMMSEKHQMKRVMDSNRTLVRDQFLQLLVKGDVRDRLEIDQHLAHLDLTFEYSYFTILNFEFDDWMRMNYLLDQNEIRARRKLIRMLLEKELEDEGFDTSIINVELRRIIVLLNFSHDGEDPETPEMIIRIVDGIREQILQASSISVSVGMGSIVDSLLEISKSYYLSFRALEYKILYGNGQVLFINDIKREKDSHFLDKYTISFSEDKLQDAVVSGDEERIAAHFDESIDHLVRLGAEHPYVRTVFLQYVALLAGLPYALNLSNYDGMSDEEYRRIAHYKSANEMKEYIRDLSASIVKAYREEAIVDPNTRLVSEIRNYVQNNFDRDIGLETVADELYVSKYHLSRVFKRTAGETFNEYLTNLRMKKAKVLLSDESIDIQTVARQVGYENANSFRRAFKQKFGLSPSAYRHRYASFESVSAR